MNSPSGKLVIFSAPSGAGKTTIVKHMIERFPFLEFSVSATCREPRGDERHGVDYYFLSQDDFKKRIGSGDFVEYEEVYPGQFYGTLRSEVERIWRKGHHVIFDVDVKGGLNLKKQYGDLALAIFVKPPSVEALEHRLRLRATEPEEKIRMRVAKATKELSFETLFDKVVVNDTLEHALENTHLLLDQFLETKTSA